MEPDDRTLRRCPDVFPIFPGPDGRRRRRSHTIAICLFHDCRLLPQKPFGNRFECVFVGYLSWLRHCPVNRSRHYCLLANRGYSGCSFTWLAVSLAVIVCVHRSSRIDSLAADADSKGTGSEKLAEKRRE